MDQEKRAPTGSERITLGSVAEIKRMFVIAKTIVRVITIRVRARLDANVSTEIAASKMGESFQDF